MVSPPFGAGNAASQHSLLWLSKAADLKKRSQFEAAAQAYMQAITLAPMHAGGYQELLSMLLQLGDLDNADIVQQNIPPALYQQSPGLQYLHAHLLAEKGQYAAAIALFLRLEGATGIDAAGLSNNIGTCFNRQDRFDDALAWYDRAAQAGMNTALLYKNRAGILNNRGDRDAAARVYAEGAARFPADSDLLYEYANFLLKAEQYEQGFRHYVHRWQKVPGQAAPRLPLPRWDGTPVRSLLVLGEQGVGDQIVYSALLPAALAKAQQVTLTFDPRLAPLLRRSFPSLAFADPDVQPPEDELKQRFDAWIAAGDLGALFAEAIGWTGGYLQADTERCAALRDKYRQRFPGKKLVGISWKSQRALYGTKKTAGLDAWGPVLTQENCQFISLQYGDTAADLARARALFGVEILQDPDVDAFNDLDGLAAQAHACNLVITTSNSTAHLAAATRTPTWVILPLGSGLCWYWGFLEDAARWYPEARLFRATEPGNWAPVLTRVAAALKDVPA